MMQCNGDKPSQSQPVQQPAPKSNKGGSHERNGAREGGEQVFADKAEKRAKDKHRPQKS